MSEVNETLEEEVIRLRKENKDLEFRLSRVQKIVVDGYMRMPYGHLTHEQMAGMVRMLMRDTLNHEAIVVAARDRIIYLAREVEDLKEVLSGVIPNGYKLLRNSTNDQRSYLSDSEQYHSACPVCERGFTGHKHRGVCNVCMSDLLVTTSKNADVPDEKEHDVYSQFLNSTKKMVVDSIAEFEPNESREVRRLNFQTKTLNPAQRLLEKKRLERLNNSPQ